MTDYKTLKGFKTKILGSDPSPLFEGQVWYDTGDRKLKVRGFTAAVWTESGDLNTARSNGQFNGSQTAGVGCGGGNATVSEEYNGVGWTEGNNLQTGSDGAMGGGSAGSQTAAIIGGGNPSPRRQFTELYDGTNWSEAGDLGTGRYGIQGFGSTTAAVAASGYPGPTVNSEEWNGTGWTEGNNVNAGRSTQAGFGTQTAGVLVGSAICEEFDGTSWTESDELNNSRSDTTGGGTQTAGFTAGGSTTAAYAETYDGSTWSTAANINTIRGACAGGGGTTSAGIISGGYNSGIFPSPHTTGYTEEFTGGESTLELED